MYASAAATSASGKVRSILDAQPAVRDPPEQVRDHRVDARVLGHQRPAEEDAAQRIVLRPQIPRLDVRAGATRHADADEHPAIGERADAVNEVLAADRIEDHVGAAPVGQFACPVDEALAGVVDPVVEPERLQAFELLVAGAVEITVAPACVCQLDRGQPDATRAGVDQGDLAGLEVAGGEQALLCGPVCDGNEATAHACEASALPLSYAP
jgi:hypothetical protein